ncbi:MAG: glycosyltransferase [Lachnospiraceae bacterium]|nr:glycosyltransferase [Lachnospiraceae bacterium]
MNSNNKDAFGLPLVIPSYEPDEKLLRLLADLGTAGFRNIIIVDDGSGENYRDIFEQAQKRYKITLLRHDVNQGKGRALKTAFSYILENCPGEVGCITADSDGQHTPACILSCAEALMENPSCLIMGCRCFDQENVPARSEFGNKCTRLTMKYMAGVSVTDTQTGLRGIPSAFMRELLFVKGEKFEFETNMLLETKSQGIPIVEVPIQTIYIEENKSSHFNPIKDSVRIYMMFGKFLFSSLSSSVVDLVLFSAFCFLFRGKQWGALTYIVLATVLARILSAAYNYLINYKVVFKSKNSVKSTLIKYCLLAVCQMVCSAVLVDMLYPIFGGWEVLVKVPVDVALFFLSFFIQRELVYR